MSMIAALLVIATCQAPPPARGGAEPAPLAVAFAGCESVRAGPICLLAGDRRRLRLWLPGAAARDVTASTDRGPAPIGFVAGDATPESHGQDDDGTALELSVPAGARWLAVERAAAPGVAAARWRLALAELAPEPVLQHADQLRRTDAIGADAFLLAALAHESDPDRRARMGALRARIALAQGHTEEATQGLRRAFEAARLAGRVTDAVHDAFALAHVLIMSQLAFAPARELLDQVAPLTVVFPEGGAELAYYQGLLGLHGGDLRAALRAFRVAAQRARHLGLSALEGYAEIQRAITLAVVGRGAEALALGRRVVERAAARPRDARELPCNRAEPEADLAWIALMLWRGDGDSAGAASDASVDPGPALASARRALTREGCADPIWTWNMALNETLFAIARADLGGAQRSLASLGPAAVSAPPSPYLAVWADETRARLALALAQPARALGIFAHEQALARAAGFPDGILRAEIGMGRTLLQMRRRREAAIHLHAAQTAFEDLLGSVPFGEGRDAFLQSHDESGRFLIDALVRLGRLREAFAVARVRRARALGVMTQSARLGALSRDERRRWDQTLAAYRAGRAHLEQEAEGDWQLPADGLARARERRRDQEHHLRALLDQAYELLQGQAGGPPTSPPTDSPVSTLSWPSAGELYVGYLPTDRGWLALVASSSRVVSHVLPGGAAPVRGASAQLAARLLTPIAARLAAARRVRFFPHGAMAHVDLHALPFAGGVLGDSVSVEYGVDVPLARPATTRPAPAAFLIIDDPTQDLGRTRSEANAVAAALSAGSVTRLEGDSATRERVLDALPLARGLHFAGHGSVDGLDGLDSALPLARGGRLLAADVLALASVPEIVTLSACEAAGRSGPDAVGVPLGMAAAFLAAGAAVVVAPARAVTDGDARSIMAALYRTLGPPGAAGVAARLAPALGAAEREVRRDTPNADWSAFRVLVR